MTEAQSAPTDKALEVLTSDRLDRALPRAHPSSVALQALIDQHQFGVTMASL